MQKCKTYHYNVNGQNIELEEKLNVNKFISKEEFELATTPNKDDEPYDNLVSKQAVKGGYRNKITGEIVDLYFFKNIKNIVSALIVIIFLASCGSKSGKRVRNQKQFIIIPMNQDNEGRPLFTLKTKDSTYDYMYAEEIAVSLIRDSVIINEMVHICDHDECWENVIE